MATIENIENIDKIVGKDSGMPRAPCDGNPWFCENMSVRKANESKGTDRTYSDSRFYFGSPDNTMYFTDGDRSYRVPQGIELICIP